MRYLVLQTSEGKAGVLEENEAEQLIYDFCEENHLTYKGLDRVQYRVNENQLIEVAALEDDPKLGSGWNEEERTDIRKTVQD